MLARQASDLHIAQGELPCQPLQHHGGVGPVNRVMVKIAPILRSVECLKRLLDGIDANCFIEPFAEHICENFTVSKVSKWTNQQCMALLLDALLVQSE